MKHCILVDSIVLLEAIMHFHGSLRSNMFTWGRDVLVGKSNV